MPGLVVMSQNGGMVDVPEPDEYYGHLVDLSVLRAAARRQRKTWLGAALVGLVIGAAFHVFVPAKYAAETDLYMVEPVSSDTAQSIADDVSLLQTRAVAAKAVAALHLNVSAEEFLGTFSGTAVSDVILTIELSARTQTEAIAYDNAVAKAFFNVRSQELSTQTNLVVDALQAQVNLLDKQIQGLTAEVNSISAGKAGPETANDVASLVDLRTTEASQIVQLQSEQQQDLQSVRQSVDGSQVLDPAAVKKVSEKKVIATDGLTGLAGGLGLSLGFILVAAAISERPRRRADVAAALGVPVELSIGHYRSPRLLRNYRLRRRLKRPGTSLRITERWLGGHLSAERGSALAVVVMGPSELAMQAVANVAARLAGEGKRVVVADMADGRPLRRLLGVKGRAGEPLPVRLGSAEFVLVVSPEDPAEMLNQRPKDADVVLTLAMVHPAFGGEPLASWADSAVMVVTAGKPTATQMASGTQMLHHSGIAVRSAILVGSDHEDDSTGLVESESPVPPRWSDRDHRSLEAGSVERTPSL
jgi:hypothetical protein